MKNYKSRLYRAGHGLPQPSPPFHRLALAGAAIETTRKPRIASLRTKGDSIVRQYRLCLGLVRSMGANCVEPNPGAAFAKAPDSRMAWRNDPRALFQFEPAFETPRKRRGPGKRFPPGRPAMAPQAFETTESATQYGAGPSPARIVWRGSFGAGGLARVVWIVRFLATGGDQASGLRVIEGRKMAPKRLKKRSRRLDLTPHGQSARSRRFSPLTAPRNVVLPVDSLVKSSGSPPPPARGASSRALPSRSSLRETFRRSARFPGPSTPRSRRRHKNHRGSATR